MPAPPRTADLLPYLDEHWREAMVSRGIDGRDLPLYPPNAPTSARPDFVASRGDAGTLLAALQSHVLEPWGTRAAILNCLHGAMALYSEDMGAALASAVNAWLAREWLDRDPRLRASIVVPMQNVEYAVDEIERCAKDKRFVQVLVLAMQEVPLGRRQFWPIYAACERHGLPLGIHAGSAYRNPVTSLGWPTSLTSELSDTHRFPTMTISGYKGSGWTSRQTNGYYQYGANGTLTKLAGAIRRRGFHVRGISVGPTRDAGRSRVTLEVDHGHAEADQVRKALLAGQLLLLLRALLDLVVDRLADDDERPGATGRGAAGGPDLQDIPIT